MDEISGPHLPPGGESSTLSTISQSLSFHTSPHLFLSGSETDPEAPTKETRPLALRAKILNRNVAIMVSFNHCKKMLGVQESGSRSEENCILTTKDGQEATRTSFGVLPSYRQLMVDFFPQPNLLLLDAPDHKPHREIWNENMVRTCHDSSGILSEIAREHVASWELGEELDLYEQMKKLGWRMLLAVFLDLQPADPQYKQVVKWQEELLRGQFSLFPVSINTPFWRSARSRGLDARRKLQAMLKKRIETMQPQCPFHSTNGKLRQEDLSSNALLFTSSIAVKAVASLLTASLLNLHLFPSEPSLASRVRSLAPKTRETLLDSILLETERLSPPVIGVMRRMQEDIVLRQSGNAGDPGTLIPEGWDAWLYFVGANRSESVYSQAHKFVPDRFVDEGALPSLTFGFGDKTCLGRDFVRRIIRTVASVIIDSGIDLRGSVDSEGVRGWLGWDTEVSAESLARDLKQLPCQRPRDPIKVQVTQAA
jgi:cytochrome P450